MSDTERRPLVSDAHLAFCRDHYQRHAALAFLAMERAGARWIDEPVQRRVIHDEAKRVRLWRVRNPEKYAAQIARNNAKRQERRGK